MMPDWAAKQKFRNWPEVLRAMACRLQADGIPKVELTGAIDRCASRMDGSAMYRVLRPELVAGPKVPTPPAAAAAVVVVLTECDAH
jgi:hypothetical protein